MNRRTVGLAVVALVALTLVAYILAHSPVRASCRVLCWTPELTEMLSAVWLLGAALAGAWAAAASHPSLAGLERGVTFGVVAYGLVVIPAAILGWIGDRADLHILRPPLGPVLLSVPALLVVAWAVRRGWRPTRPRWSLPELTPLLAVVLAVGGVVFLLTSAIAVRYPLTGHDELGYHAPLAVLFWRTGSLSAFVTDFPTAWPYLHPGSAELYQGLLLLIGGEPLAALGQVPFALLGAVGVALFARRLGLGPGSAFLSGSLFLFAPMVLLQGGQLRNDVIAGALVIAAFSLAVAAPERWTIHRWGLIGLTAGLAAATKLSVLPAIAALFLVVAIDPPVAHASDPPTGGPRPALDRGLPGGGRALVAAQRGARRQPGLPGGIPFIVKGEVDSDTPTKDNAFVPDERLWPLYPLLEDHSPPSGFGVPFAILILPALLAGAVRARRRPMLAVGVLAVVAIPAWWFLTRHEPRMLLGLAGLGFACLPFALVIAGRAWRMAMYVLLTTAVILSGVITVTTQLAEDAARPMDRVAFYDTQWLVLPDALRLPESEPIVLDDQCSVRFQNRVYPFLGTGRDRPVARLRCSADLERVDQVLQRLGGRYVYASIRQGSEAVLDARYPADRFELVARDTVPDKPGELPVERRLYRRLEAAS